MSLTVSPAGLQLVISDLSEQSSNFQSTAHMETALFLSHTVMMAFHFTVQN